MAPVTITPMSLRRCHIANICAVDVTSEVNVRVEGEHHGSLLLTTRVRAVRAS